MKQAAGSMADSGAVPLLSSKQQSPNTFMLDFNKVIGLSLDAC
jgi:hypothetical protein